MDKINPIQVLTLETTDCVYVIIPIRKVDLQELENNMTSLLNVGVQGRREQHLFHVLIIEIIVLISCINNIDFLCRHGFSSEHDGA